MNEWRLYAWDPPYSDNVLTQRLQWSPPLTPLPTCTSTTSPAFGYTCTASPVDFGQTDTVAQQGCSAWKDTSVFLSRENPLKRSSQVRGARLSIFRSLQVARQPCICRTPCLSALKQQVAAENRSEELILQHSVDVTLNVFLNVLVWLKGEVSHATVATSRKSYRPPVAGNEIHF